MQAGLKGKELNTNIAEGGLNRKGGGLVTIKTEGLQYPLEDGSGGREDRGSIDGIREEVISGHAAQARLPFALFLAISYSHGRGPRAAALGWLARGRKQRVY